jgi:hypothetical protein
MIMEAQPEVRELYQVHTENRHLKETISALRDELESNRIGHKVETQKALATANEGCARKKADQP